MTPKNKYVNRSKISEAKFREIIKLFCLDLDAVQISKLTGLNRNTINRYLTAIRERIAEYCEECSPLSGQIEVDESYFGGRRSGKRGRGAAGNTIVFGLLKRNGKVYTEIGPNVAVKTLQAIIRGKVSMNSVVHSDKWRGYDGLVMSDMKNILELTMVKVNMYPATPILTALRDFWGFAKTRLTKFHGIPKSSFYLHLKECEFRFNSRSDDMYKLLLKIIRQNPLF